MKIKAENKVRAEMRAHRLSLTGVVVATALGFVGQAVHAQTALKPPPAEYRWWALNVGAYVAHNFGLWATNATGVISTGKGITIAVVDTGVRSSHEELSGRVKTGYNVISPTSSTNDDNGHGTHVSGIAAAAINLKGVVGIAPDAFILPIKVLDASGSGAWENIVTGITWADKNYVNVPGTPTAKTIFSMSLGGTSYANDAFKLIASLGSIGVVAAGNSYRNIRTSDFAYQAIVGTAKGSSIVVGAVDSSNKIATFSNTPGKDLTLQQYFLVAPGVSIYSSVNGADNDYATKSGTSMATPVVSGAAAVVWGAWPYLTAKDVVSSLLLSAKDLGAPGVDSTYGRGLLDLVAALQPIGSYCITSNTTCTGSTVKTYSSKSTSGSLSTSLSSPSAAGAAVLESSARVVGYDSIGRHFFFPVGAALKAGGVNATYNMDSWIAKSQPVTQVANTGAVRFSIQGDPNAGITGFSYRQEASDNSYVMAFKGNGLVPFGLAHSDFSANSFVAADNMKISYLGLMESPSGMAYGRELGNGLSLRFGYLVGGSAANKIILDAASPYTPIVSSSATLAEVSQRFGSLQVIGTFGSMREDGSFLGASSMGRYTQGNTTFSTMSSVYDFGAGVAALASYTRGQSRGMTNDAVANYDTRTESYSLGLLKSAAFFDKDRLALSYSVPSRVTAGGVTLNAGVDVNMETGAPIYGQIPVSLTPQGRERRWELSWSAPIKSGNVALTALRRLEPNHNAAAPAENIVGARLTKSF